MVGSRMPATLLMPAFDATFGRGATWVRSMIGLGGSCVFSTPGRRVGRIISNLTEPSSNRLRMRGEQRRGCSSSTSISASLNVGCWPLRVATHELIRLVESAGALVRTAMPTGGAGRAAASAVSTRSRSARFTDSDQNRRKFSLTQPSQFDRFDARMSFVFSEGTPKVSTTF